MKKKHDIQEELQELSPLLAQIREGEEGYKVPHLYFESLQNKVLDKVNEQPKKSGFIFSFLWLRGLAVAASVAVLLLAGVFIFNNSNKAKIADLEGISTDALAMYLDENVEDWDLDLLIEDDLQFDFSKGLNLDGEEWEGYIEEEFLNEDVGDLF